MKNKPLWKIKREEQIFNRVLFAILIIADIGACVLFTLGVIKVLKPTPVSAAETAGLYAGFAQELYVLDVSSVDVIDDSECIVSAEFDPIEKVEQPYTDDELECLAHLIYAECGADWISDTTIYYTASVVMNRVCSDLYPNSIYEVINDTRYGVQYSCKNYYMNNEPSERCYEIAEDVLVMYYTTGETYLPSNVLGQAGFQTLSGTYTVIDEVVFSYYEN